MPLIDTHFNSETPTLDHYVSRRLMTAPQAAALREAVRTRKNILVVGSTGSGKTMLINAIVAELVYSTRQERIAIVEDLPEIHCRAQNVVRLRAEGNAVRSQRVCDALRLRPDTLIVDDVREHTASSVIVDAWANRSCSGVASIRGRTTADGLRRLTFLMQQCHPLERAIERVCNRVINLQSTVARFLGRHPSPRVFDGIISLQHAAARLLRRHPSARILARAIDLVVNVQRTEGGPRVTEIVTLTGFAQGKFTCKRLA